jgi:hypothetical protein
MTTTSNSTNSDVMSTEMRKTRYSLFNKIHSNITATTTTTTRKSVTSSTNLPKEKEDTVKVTKVIYEDSGLSTTKVVVIVIVAVVSVLSCVAVIWVVVVYLKKKKNVNLPPIHYHRNQPVIIPDFGESPIGTVTALSIRNRINHLSNNLPRTDITQQFESIVMSKTDQKQQQQQQQLVKKEIEIADIKKVIPDFEPFEGFDIVEFRKLLDMARVSKPPRNCSN